MGRDRRVTLLALLALLAAACGKTETGQKSSAIPSASAITRPKTPDRLAPGELAPGTVQIWGFTAPKELTLERRFPDAAHFVGPIPPEQVANYVRTRVETERVEIGAARTVFPSVRIKGGPADKIFRFEVLGDRVGSKLVIRDITPPPVEPGLSEEERWRRAGMTPQGEPLDRNKLQ